MTTASTEKEWQYDLPDTEEITRAFMFAIDEAEEAGDENRLAEIEDRIQNIKTRVCGDARQNWEEAFFRLMEERKVRKIEVGDLTYKPHRPKVVKCRSNKATYQAVMEAVEGDDSKIPDLLGSDAWKPSSVKSIVGEKKYGELFREERANKVKIEGREQRFTKG